MDKYHLHLKIASYCMFTMTRSVCCVSLFLKYILVMKMTERKEEGEFQESIQSSITTDRIHHMGK